MTPTELALLTSLGGGLPQRRMTMAEFEDSIGIRLGNPVLDRPTGQWSRTPDRVTGPPPAPIGPAREVDPQMRIRGREPQFIGLGMSSVGPNIPPGKLPPAEEPTGKSELVKALERQVIPPARPTPPNGSTYGFDSPNVSGPTTDPMLTPSQQRQLDVPQKPKSTLQMALEDLMPFGTPAEKNWQAYQANQLPDGSAQLPMGSNIRLGPDGKATISYVGPAAGRHLGEIDEHTGLPIMGSQFNPESRQAYQERVAARTKGMKQKLEARRAAKAEEHRRRNTSGDLLSLSPEPENAVQAGVQSVQDARALAKAAGRFNITREEAEQAWLAGVRGFERQDELKRQQARAQFAEEARRHRDIAEIAMRIFIARKSERDFTFEKALEQARTAYENPQPNNPATPLGNP